MTPQEFFAQVRDQAQGVADVRWMFVDPQSELYQQLLEYCDKPPKNSGPLDHLLLRLARATVTNDTLGMFAHAAAIKVLIQRQTRVGLFVPEVSRLPLVCGQAIMVTRVAHEFYHHETFGNLPVFRETAKLFDLLVRE